LLHKWLQERLALEKRSLTYRIGKQQRAIDYTKLLIFASTKLDVIFKALRAADSKTYLVRALKITPEQAEQILELKVRQLSKLDQDQMKVKLKEQEAQMKQLNIWLAKPRPKILQDTQKIMDAISKERKFQSDKNRSMSLK
jgi:topoisomerase-4 subunit A